MSKYEFKECCLRYREAIDEMNMLLSGRGKAKGMRSRDEIEASLNKCDRHDQGFCSYCEALKWVLEDSEPDISELHGMDIIWEEFRSKINELTRAVNELRRGK